MSKNIVSPNPSSWNVCDRAEPRLEAAIQHRSLILVNGLMVVKALGKTAGIANRVETTEGLGTELGVWYTPRQRDHRMAIISSFLKGEPHIDFPDPVEWVRIVDVNLQRVYPDMQMPDNFILETLMNNTVEAIDYLSTEGYPTMPHGLTRRDYYNVDYERIYPDEVRDF